MKKVIIAACAGAALWSAALWSAMAVAADIKVLSAGAVKTGLIRAADEFKRASGHEVKVQFNTAPQLAKKLADGEAADILIAPPAVLDEQAKSNRISAQGRIMLGRVGAGVVIRASAPSPDVTTTAALKQAMLGADAIVYNTASTGLYLEKLFERIGIAGEIKAKTTRHPTGEAVMEHVINGKGNDLGFGAITEIKVFEPKGAKLVGPLPPDIQNYTSYGAALLTGATSADAAKAFLAFLATPEGKRDFRGRGDRVDAVRRLPRRRRTAVTSGCRSFPSSCGNRTTPRPPGRRAAGRRRIGRAGRCGSRSCRRSGRRTPTPDWPAPRPAPAPWPTCRGK